MTTMVVLALLAAPALGTVKARSALQVLRITGTVQVKYSDSGGAHVLSLDARNYYPDGLPADAEILVLGGDALFELGGARLYALPGTLFSAGEADDREYLLVSQGELSVRREGKTTVLNSRRPRFSFAKSRFKEEPGEGFLR